MNNCRLAVLAGLAAVAMLACTSEKPNTQDHVFKGQAQSMEKAKQVEGVMQEHVDSLNQQVEKRQAE